MTSTLVQKFKQAHALILSAKHILLVTYKDPDEDSIGSMLALAHYFTKIGKTFTAYAAGDMRVSFSALPGHNMLTNTLPAQKPDCIMALNCGDMKRLPLDKINARNARTIVLDHHVQTNQKGDVCIVDVSFSSTAEMVYHFFIANNIAINDDMAACIWAGIVKDTGRFLHGNTSSETLAVASALKKHSFDAQGIAKKIHGMPSLASALIIGLLLSRVIIDKETKATYSYISYKDIARIPEATWRDTKGTSHFINLIDFDHVQCVILFEEKKERLVTLSLRSNPTWGYNVQKLASKFCGGGHTYAAGARIKAPLEKAIKMVLAEIKGGNFRI